MAGNLTAALDDSRQIANTLSFACRNPDLRPDFAGCGGPAAEDYWNHFTPARGTSLLTTLDEFLKLPEPVGTLNGTKVCPRCSREAGSMIVPGGCLVRRA